MAWAVLIPGNQQLGQERQSRRHPEVDPQLLDSPEPMPLGSGPHLWLAGAHGPRWPLSDSMGGNSIAQSTFGQTRAS